MNIFERVGYKFVFFVFGFKRLFLIVSEGYYVIEFFIVEGFMEMFFGFGIDYLVLGVV